MTIQQTSIAQARPVATLPPAVVEQLRAFFENAGVTPADMAGYVLHEKLIPIGEVAKIFGGISRALIYQKVAKNELPKPYRVSTNRVAWSLMECLETVERQKAEQRPVISGAA